jgi:hypothetical protein
MLALESARKSLQAATPPSCFPCVILSAAYRLPTLPEIGPLRFRLGTHSRRISLRSRGGSRAPIATSRSNRLRTQTNRELNGFKMSTSQIHDFKSRKMSTSEKTPGGGYDFRGWKSRQGRHKLAQGGSRGARACYQYPKPPKGRHRGARHRERQGGAILVRCIINPCTRPALKFRRMNTSRKHRGRGA